MVFDILAGQRLLDAVVHALGGKGLGALGQRLGGLFSITGVGFLRPSRSACISAPMVWRSCGRPAGRHRRPARFAWPAACGRHPPGLGQRAGLHVGLRRW
jgi:hypothetical protein